MYLLARLGFSMDQADGTHPHHAGGLGLPWVMTSYKEKKKKNVRRLVQQHHKKALSTEQVWEKGTNVGCLVVCQL